MRGKQSKVRVTKPDAKYGSPVITKFINYVMQDGEKAKSEKIVYAAMERAAQLQKVEVKELVDKVIENVMPKIEVRPRRIGGANYQVPVPVSENRGIALAVKWIVSACREKQGKPINEFLSEELIAAYKNEGTAVKKRETVEKMAEANRAYAQFKW